MKMRLPIEILIATVLICPNESSAQWVKTSSPEILIPIATQAVAVKGDTIFAGAYRGTIYRSMNDGLTWVEVRAGLSPSFYEAYTFLISEDTVFAGASDGVYRSTDWGDSWSLVSSGLPSPSSVLSILKKDSILFAGTGDGVYRSIDAGQSWFPARSGLPQNSSGDYLDVSSVVALGGTIYSGGYGGVYKSQDNGQSWQKANLGLPFRINTLIASGNNLLAGSDYDSSGSVYLSTDSGWRSISTGLPRQTNGLLWSYKPVYSLAVINGIIFAGVQDAGAYRSTDGGASWAEVNSGLPPDHFGYIASFGRRGNDLFAASFDGMYRLAVSDTTWHPVFTTYPGEVQCRAVGAGAKNPFALFTANYWNGLTSGAYRSTDHGYQWLSDSGLPYFTSMRRVNGELYALGGSLFRSSDDGVRWERIDSGSSWGVSGDLTAFVSEDSIFFVSQAGYFNNGDFGGVYRSTDRGRYWESVGLQYEPVRSLVFHHGVLFAAVWGFMTYPGFYRSTDLGNTWIHIDSLVPGRSVPLSLTYFNDQIFASTSTEGIIITSDSGQHWTQYDAGLKADTSGRYPIVSDFLTINSVLFAGTNRGVIFLRAGADAWQSLNDDLPLDASNITELTATDDMLYAKTDYGIWRRALSPILHVGPNPLYSPAAFSLSQNFPNPFNPTTFITYQLPVSSFVKLRIYNLLGQEVRTLVEAIKDAGYWSLEWDATNVPTGIYLCRLEASDIAHPLNTITQVRKMILLR